MDTRLFAGRPAQEKVSVLVVFREQADISGAARIPDRLERRRFVYESLRAHADAAQATLQTELRKKGLRFRSHFLVNMLEVEADLDTASELAARSEVALLAANRPAALSHPEVDLRAASASSGGVEPNRAGGSARFVGPGHHGTGHRDRRGGYRISVGPPGLEESLPGLGWSRGIARLQLARLGSRRRAQQRLRLGRPGPLRRLRTRHRCRGLRPGSGGRRYDRSRSRGEPDRLPEHGRGRRHAGATTSSAWFLAPTDSRGEDPRLDLAPDVINNSWGCPPSEGCTDPDILNATVDAMRAAGIAMSFSAGNLGAFCFTLANAPAVGPGSFAIGATWLDDTIAAFSAFGPVTSNGSNRLKPDLTAPGVNLRTAGLGGSYVPRFSGTSAAAPHVAGAFALLWSAVPGLRGDVDASEEILKRSAVPLTSSVNCGLYRGSLVPNPIFGWGRLDVASAFAMARTERAQPLVVHDPRATRTLPPRP